MSHHHEPEVTVLPPNKEKIKKLWMVALILFVLTVVEFGIAFMVPHGSVKTTVFVVMTIIKAAYIVGEFMHLRYEAKLLMWSIIIPMGFVIWMLVAFVYEGMKIELVRW